MSSAAVFERYSKSVEALRPDEAPLMRRCASDDYVLSLVPEDATWDVPHRLMAAVQWLILGNEAPDYRDQTDPWTTFRDTLRAHEAWVVEFVRNQPIQTNEPQRCFALLPIFLTIARRVNRPLDLLELGASAGLNLLWDLYDYRYGSGSWGLGNSTLTLDGEERAPVPGDLLRQPVTVRRRRGIDLSPLDASTEEGLRLLSSFVGSDQDRLDRLRRAASVARSHPPELIRGDYVDALSALLDERTDDALMVVFQTLSTIYMPMGQRNRVREVVDQAGRSGPLVWISTPTPEEHGQRRGDYPLELAIWPPGERRIVARMDNGGNWIEWMG